MIHQYKLGGKNIVIDVCSGCVHSVDELAYDLISLFETNDKATVLKILGEKYANKNGVSSADIEECYEQIEFLKEKGKLFSPDTFEPMANTLKQKTAGVVKALQP